MNSKVVALCVVLPCIIAMVSCAYMQSGGYMPQTYYQPRDVGQYQAYAANSYQAARQSRLFTYLLGGLYFLNLFNFTGNRIVG